MSRYGQESELVAAARATWRAARADPRAGANAADAVVRSARAARDPLALALALRTRAWCERELYLHDAAARTIAAALHAARAAERPDVEADVRAVRAAMLLELGSPGRARAELARARAALGGATTLELELQEAVVATRLGHLREAAAAYEAALPRSAGAPPDVRVRILNNLGNVLDDLGRVAAAERHLEEATVVATELGDATHAIVLHNRACVALGAGDAGRAFALFDAAEQGLVSAGMPLGEHLLDRLRGLSVLRLVDEADEAARRSIAHLDVPGGALLVAEARLEHARVLLARGEAATAAEEAARAARAFARQSRPAWRAQADAVRGEARHAAGHATRRDLAAALAATRTLAAAGYRGETVAASLVAARLALDLRRPAEAGEALACARRHARGAPALARLGGEVASALAAHVDGDRARLRGACRRGLAGLAAFRAALPTAELRAAASAYGVELAALGLADAVEAGRAGDALAWLERGRLAALAVDGSRSHDPRLAEALGELRALARSRHLDDDVDAIERTRREQRRLEARVRALARSGDGSGGAPARPATASDLRPALDGRAFVAIARHAGRFVAIVVEGRGAGTVPLGAIADVQAEADAVRSALRRLGRPRSATLAAATAAALDHGLAALDAALVAPLGRLPDAVVIAPTPSLHAIPWHALPSLVPRQVVVAPSATLWLRARARPRPDGPVVLVAGPDLPGAPEEVAALARIHAGATVLDGAAASVARVSAALAGSGLAHLACHGALRADNPMFSRLELADGPLLAQDLEHLPAPPGRIVLAACESGAARELPGEELLGLLTTLLTGGAQSVVASPVHVPDLATVELMAALHAGLRDGLEPVDALGRARAATDDGTPRARAAAVAFAAFGV